MSAPRPITKPGMPYLACTSTFHPAEVAFQPFPHMRSNTFATANRARPAEN